MDAIEYLTAVAVVDACRAGHEYRIERSSRSEATYIKVCRGGTWYGLRIASHLPYYRSSADYEQVLVPRAVESAAELADAAAAVAAGVTTGGRVVADPSEVDEALFAAWRRLRHDVTAETSPGVRWTWDEDRLRWLPSPPADRRAASAEGRASNEEAPRDPPRPSLSPREESAIRHRLNLRAAWAHDEQQRFTGRTGA